VHAVSYQRLSRLMLDLYSLQISEGALDAAFRRVQPVIAHPCPSGITPTA
jgi:transposase